MARLLKAIASWIKMQRAVRSGDNHSRLNEVLKVLEYLEGQSTREAYQRFLKRPFSRRVLNPTNSLSLMLEKSASYPEGSLGAAYHLHVTNGVEDKFSTLSAKRLSGSNKDSYYWFRRRVYDIHDLIHVLFGYDKYRLGEGCVIRVHSCAGGPKAWKLLSYIGWMRVLFVNGPRDWWRVYEVAIKEAEQMAKPLGDINRFCWEDLLEEPLDSVRDWFGIAAPTLYLETEKRSRRRDKQWQS